MKSSPIQPPTRSQADRSTEGSATVDHGQGDTGSGGARSAAGAGVPRRTIARGALWAVPTVALGVAASAYAASTDVYGATVCDLFYAQGASTNYQGLEVRLGVTSTANTIAQGTTFRWTVTMSNYGSGAHQVPTTNYSANNRWRLDVSPASGQTATSFTVTLTVLASDVTVSELNCIPKLIWNDTYSVVGGTRIDISGSATVTSPSQGQTQASGLSFSVAKRFPTSVNTAGRRAHQYLSKSGIQTCYPPIKFVMTAASKLTTCGDDANDTSVTYPDGTCVKLTGTTADQGTQQILPQRC